MPRLHALLVLVSLGLFTAVYFGTVALGAGFLAWAIAFGFVHSPELLWLAVVQGMLCPSITLALMSLLRALCRRPRGSWDNAVEIFAVQQPRLFTHIRQVCDEIHAPYPKRVFVYHRANARASFHGDWLLFATARDLLIGLGYVNFLNRTEFKALLAHECAHFAQAGRWLDGPVHAALGVINSFLNGPHPCIDAWCRLHPLLAWPAWIHRGMHWSLGRILNVQRRALLRSHRAMIRQMEFDADRSAVQAAGSDALIQMLRRGDIADRCLRQAIDNLETSSDSDFSCADLFHHQTEVAVSFGGDEGWTGDALRHRTHPSNPERERNARNPFVPSAIDGDSSAWQLFDDADGLRAEVTRNLLGREIPGTFPHTAPSNV